LPALTSATTVDVLQHDEVAEINLDTNTIRCAAGEFTFPPLSRSVRRIIEAGGLIAMLQKQLAEVDGS
jgi:3-isopropylmalate/(R)-2-methylmalate dehydratase small subunit